MFVFLSKLLPLFIYPLGFCSLILILSLILRKKAKISKGLMIAAIIILWIFSNKTVAYSLVKSLEWQNLPQQDLPITDAIVVLGGATEPRQYPRMTVEVNSAGDRVLYGAYLFKQGKAGHILLSGGNITWMGTTPSTPATEMADILAQLGVSGDAVWIQSKSQNTYEDALYSNQMLSEHNIKRITLVTSAMHMPRALALFKHQGLEVIPAPCDFTVTQDGWNDLWHPNFESFIIGLLPNTSSLNMSTNVFKEYIGILTYKLQGWL